ncbi:hypothetical protein HAX54_017282, partial [Datura stramonium]|nr:hypothetical protein [Datura stramonium]
GTLEIHILYTQSYESIVIPIFVLTSYIQPHGNLTIIVNALSHIARPDAHFGLTRAVATVPLRRAVSRCGGLTLGVPPAFTLVLLGAYFTKLFSPRRHLNTKFKFFLEFWARWFL